MDLVGDMLCSQLQARHSDDLEVTRVQPAFVSRLGRVETRRSKQILFNADRALNRFFDYPRVLRQLRDHFDVFHIADHSYAHLVHALVDACAVVNCHDLDAFRCLREPPAERRWLPFRVMARQTLAGMQLAARVICATTVTRDELIANRWIPSDRLTIIPNGVHPACSRLPDEAANAAVTTLLGPASPETLEVLHVGSSIPRKRIDVLLKVVAAARVQFPNLRLIRVGGVLDAGQQRLAQALKLEGSIVTMPFLEREVLAALYRRAAIVLLPSDAEGFGLPVIEAMACGTPVIVSDIPVLREVAAESAVYCPVGDVDAWCKTLVAMLHERDADSTRWEKRRTEVMRRASHFTWTEYADRCAAIYRECAVR